MAGVRRDMPDDVQLQAPEVVVEVFCLQARNLPQVESGTPASTYCVIEATNSHQMYKTHIVPSNLHPVWNESYQVKISMPAQQMMTVKIMAEREGQRHDEFIGVVVVPVSRIMSGENQKEGGWYEIRGEKSNVVVGPDGMSKVELSFTGRRPEPGLKPTVGWLTMRGTGNVWKRNFFMLDPYNQMLRYFASPEAMTEPAPKALGELNTRCCEVEEVQVDQPSPNMFKVKTFFAGFLLYADTPEERIRWIDSLQEVGNPPGIRILPAPPMSGKQALSLSPPTSSKENAVRNAPPSPAQREPEQPQPQQPQPVKQPTQPAASTVSPPAPVASPATAAAAAEQSPRAPNPTGPASPPQSSDPYMQLQRKFEATRRALADHVAKCRDLEGQLSQAKAAQTSNPQMEAENAGLKGEILQLREALEKEKRSVADLASSSQGSSGQLAAEIKLLKESLENKERELQESQELLSKKDLELQDKLNEMAAKAAEATSDGNQNEANLRREIDKLTTENKLLKEKADEASKVLPWNTEDQETISRLNVENKLLKESLKKLEGENNATAVARMEGEIMILKDNLEQERRVVLEMTQKMQEAHEKEVHAHQQLSELQAFDKDHDYWPQVLKKKDEELTRLRDHVDRLSGDNRKLIADNQEMKARFELGRTALANEVAQQKEKASHHEIELKRRIEEIEKRAIAAAEGYHSSLQALDAERNELRRDLHESQHALSEAKKKVLQEQQEKIQVQADLEGVQKSIKSEQELKQQVAKLQSQLLQQQREGQGRSNGKADTKLTSQDAARELIADITSTLNVRSSRVLNSTSALSPRPEQNGHHRSFNLNAPTDDELGEDPYLM